MLRNRVVAVVLVLEVEVLNEVLSLNAQEFASDTLAERAPFSPQ